MTTRCYALVPAVAGHPKTLRCGQPGAAKVLGVPVCRGHQAASKAGALEVWSRTLPRLGGGSSSR